MPWNIRRRPALAVLAVAALCVGTAGLAGPAAADDPPPEHIVNGTFDNGSTAPWWNGANTSFSVVDGRLCTFVTGGTTNPWDAIIGQNEIPLELNSDYTFSFSASSDVPATMTVTVQQGTDPFTAALARQVTLGTAAQSFSWTFSSIVADEHGQVTFQMGGGGSATICLDDVSLTGGQPNGGYHPDTGP